jgi:hypothetical protein
MLPRVVPPTFAFGRNGVRSRHIPAVRQIPATLMLAFSRPRSARGLADSDARRVVPDDEMAHRIRQWRK